MAIQRSELSEQDKERKLPQQNEDKRKHAEQHPHQLLVCCTRLLPSTGLGAAQLRIGPILDNSAHAEQGLRHSVSSRERTHIWSHRNGSP